MGDKLEWWGYKHNCGSYQAKRYFEKLDITEAQESPFVESVVGPFLAKDRDDALEIVRRLTTTKKCGNCSYRLFSICVNPKGKNYKSIESRETWDKIDDLDTCNYFTPNE